MSVISTSTTEASSAPSAPVIKSPPYSELSSLDGQDVQLIGWIHHLRIQSKYIFATLRMGTDKLIQIVIPMKVVKESSTQHVTLESFVRLTGKISKLPANKYSFLSVEMQVDKLDVLSLADASFPSICPPDAGSDVKLEKRHVFLRDEKFARITKCREEILQAIRLHFQKTECREIVPPSFTGVECEGGATLFKVQHPGKSTDKPMEAYLTQSSQFSLEMAVPAHGHCYCIAPSFRAENSHTRRHLTEFLHAESEWFGIISFEDHLQKLTEMMRGILDGLLDIGKETLKSLDAYDRVLKLRAMVEDILVLDHKDAIAKCRELGIYKDEETKTHFDERDDIPEAAERKLIDKLDRIVFLVRFPKEFKSFYMALDPEDSSRVLGCDVEVPGVGEIIGSGVREQDYERLHKRLLEAKLDPADYQEYLDLRRFGFGMTSGMGLGVDRMLTWILDLHSIRDVTTFPRFPGYLRP